MEDLEISRDGHLKRGQKSVLLLMTLGVSRPSSTLSSLSDFHPLLQPQARWASVFSSVKTGIGQDAL